jgi:hypothetical protein
MATQPDAYMLRFRLEIGHCEVGELCMHARFHVVKFNAQRTVGNALVQFFGVYVRTARTRAV